ncbi:MAG: substrate-binding domain-containing protein [Bacteroidota bacterium]
MYGINHPDQVEESLRHHVLRSRVDGMLFLSMRIPESRVQQFLRSRTPLVFVDGYNRNLDSLSIDNKQGAYLATRRLISLGHKRIGMLNANLQSLPARQRFKGYKQAMEESGLPLSASLIKSSPPGRLDGFTRESGAALMREFLALGRKRPTAILVSCDVQASGALSVLNESRLRYPEDVAIVGFDDIEMASYLGLTTMRQPMFEMGVLASEILARRLNDLRQPVSHSMFVPKLIIRKSCGASLTSEVKPQDQETQAIA